MAKKKIDLSLKEIWMCEGCGSCWQGVDPPNSCTDCGHDYFENMYDLQKDFEKMPVRA